jgi:hypothetical protein
MTDNNAAQRLNLTDIVQVLEKILNSPENSSQMMAATLMPPPSLT